MKAEGNGNLGKPGPPTQAVDASRFCLLPDGEEAFALRAASERLARKTLASLYYNWEEDKVDKLLVYRVREGTRQCRQLTRPIVLALDPICLLN